MKKKSLALIATAVMLVAVLVVGGTLAYFTDTDKAENTFTLGKVDITLDEGKVGTDGKFIDQGATRVNANDYTGKNMVPGYVFDKDPTIHVKAGSEDSYVFLDLTFNKYSSLFWLMAADASADTETEGLKDFTIFETDNSGNKVVKKDFVNDQGVFSTTKFVNYLKTNKDVRIALVNKWFGGIQHENWEIRDIITGQAVNGKSDKYITIRFAYLNKVEKSTADFAIKFMDSFQIPASVTEKTFAEAKTVGQMQNSFNTNDVNFNMIFTGYAIQAEGLDLNSAYTALFTK